MGQPLRRKFRLRGNQNCSWASQRTHESVWDAAHNRHKDRYIQIFQGHFQKVVFIRALRRSYLVYQRVLHHRQYDYVALFFIAAMLRKHSTGDKENI